MRNCKKTNKYFTNVGTTLTSKIQIIHKGTSKYSPQCRTFFSVTRKSIQDAQTRPLIAMILTVILLWISTILETLFLLKFLRHLLKKQSFLKNLKFKKLFKFLKKVIKEMLKTTDQFLFSQFFPKCLKVLYIIVCMNISWVTISITKTNLVFK